LSGKIEARPLHKERQRLIFLVCRPVPVANQIRIYW
jgi:hypothetical protein